MFGFQVATLAASHPPHLPCFGHKKEIWRVVVSGIAKPLARSHVFAVSMQVRRKISSLRPFAFGSGDLILPVTVSKPVATSDPVAAPATCRLPSVISPGSAAAVAKSDERLWRSGRFFGEQIDDLDPGAFHVVHERVDPRGKETEGE